MEKMAVSTATLQQPSVASRDFVLALCGWAEDKKALHLRLYEVTEHCSYADYILVCSGTSDRHIMAIAEELRVEGKKLGRRQLGSEGMEKGQWVLLDFGDVVVHIFHEPVREYYEIDRLWLEQRVSPETAEPMSSIPTMPPPEEDEEDEED